MEADAIRQIQREAADAILDRGVSVPLKAFRLPFRKRPVELRVTMRRPRLSGLVRFARIYLSMGVTADQMWGFGKEEEMRFLAAHGRELGDMVACTLCRGPLSRLFLRPVSWFARNCMEAEYLTGAVKRFVEMTGTGPFLPIIRSAGTMNPMEPRLSRERRGS